MGQCGLESRSAYVEATGNSLPFVNVGTGRTVKLACSELNTVCVILDNDELKCWGGGADGALGIPDDTENR